MNLRILYEKGLSKKTQEQAEQEGKKKAVWNGMYGILKKVELTLVNDLGKGRNLKTYKRKDLSGEENQHNKFC